MISRIIKVLVRVISLSLWLRLITLASTLIILNIKKTSSNSFLLFFIRRLETTSLSHPWQFWCKCSIGYVAIRDKSIRIYSIKVWHSCLNNTPASSTKILAVIYIRFPSNTNHLKGINKDEYRGSMSRGLLLIFFAQVHHELWLTSQYIFSYLPTNWLQFSSLSCVPQVQMEPAEKRWKQL